MAALAGILAARPGRALDARLDAMLEAQAHRGRGGAERWLGDAAERGIALGCVRRASPAGGLGGPLLSPCGRYLLVCDGTVLNLPELAADLLPESRGDRFTGLDLLLELLSMQGASLLSRLNGAWALAWIDLVAGRVLLARDHLGSKPLYYRAGAGGLLFASEIKGILRGADERFAFDAGVVGCFLEQTLLDAQPETFFSGIRSLQPGHRMSIRLADPPGSPPETIPYWEIPETDPFAGGAAERVEAVRELLVDAVRLRLAGDERVGVLVSGGVDSSSIAATTLRLRAPGEELRLLSGVSADARYYDPLLDSACDHLGVRTTKVPLRVAPERALPDLEELIGLNDEPVRSFINVTEHALKRAADELGLTVLLGGLGADEVFSGNLVHMVFHVQALLRDGHWLRALRAIAQVARRRTIRPRFRARIQKRYFRAIPGRSVDVRGPCLKGGELRHDLGLGRRSSHQRLLADLTQLSLPALLHFDDRVSMAFGIENRHPYLDSRVVELVAPMAVDWKLRDGFTKWLLRSSIGRDLPASVAWRKVKQGGVDAYGEWLKHDLRAPLEALFRGDLVAADLGILDRRGVQQQYDAFCRQGPDAGFISTQDIFNVVALELWARRFASYLRRP